jgi:hypothetical protein
LDTLSKISNAARIFFERLPRRAPAFAAAGSGSAARRRAGTAGAFEQLVDPAQQRQVVAVRCTRAR